MKKKRGKISKKGVKKGKNQRKTTQNDKKRAKILAEIRKITKKHPKIKKKIKHIKDPAKRLYYAMVWEVTENQPLHILENSDKRGWRDHHLDHIYPIAMGWHNNIPPEKVGNIKNLRFIHHEENIRKGARITSESKNALRRINRLK
jgi:predicted transcriptional regulator